ncbi:MAG: hypothetical protein D6808_01325 [Candidatus Dadabacteria bacterium]|nr:MAG: hypothetical protein D6808_01325 [Candidatus Dadabacteria bacterium]
MARSYVIYRGYVVKLTILFVSLYLFGIVGILPAEPFYPVWKNLTREGKRHFMSGYLHGMRDAKEIVHITADYVKKKPEESISSMNKIEHILSLSGVTPDVLVDEVDRCYADSTRVFAPLSLCISMATRRKEH